MYFCSKNNLQLVTWWSLLENFCMEENGLYPSKALTLCWGMLGLIFLWTRTWPVIVAGCTKRWQWAFLGGQQFSLCIRLQKPVCRLELKSQGVTLVSESFCPDDIVHLHIQLNNNSSFLKYLKIWCERSPHTWSQMCSLLRDQPSWRPNVWKLVQMLSTGPF